MRVRMRVRMRVCMRACDGGEVGGGEEGLLLSWLGLCCTRGSVGVFGHGWDTWYGHNDGTENEGREKGDRVDTDLTGKEADTHGRSMRSGARQRSMITRTCTHRSTEYHARQALMIRH